MKRNQEQWEVVHAYTRKQAVEDGVLIEVPDAALRPLGIRWPVAITRNLWAKCIGPVGEEVDPLKLAEPENRDQMHRLAAMLWVFRSAAKSPRGRANLMKLCLPDLDERPTEVWAHCGPGDTPEPVITLMLPEDY